MLHAGKRLKSLDQIDSGVRVRFEDGTNEHFDAVTSADGIFSSVRDHVLGGKDHAASPARW